MRNEDQSKSNINKLRKEKCKLFYSDSTSDWNQDICSNSTYMI